MNKPADMPPYRILKFLTLFIPLFSAAVVTAQVPVEVSKQKIVVEGKVYYMHQVLKGQTLYSISKAYNVAIDRITSENIIPPGGIHEGQMLKIPDFAADLSARKDTMTVVRNETRPPTMVNKTVHVEQQKPAGAIPSTQDERYLFHRVRRGETLSSIAEEYGITVRELKKANKGLLFPHEGDYLLIRRTAPAMQHTETNQVPVTDTVTAAGQISDTSVVAEEPEVFTVAAERTVLTTLHGSVKAAVLLPFFIEENNDRTYIDSTKRNSRGNKIYKEVNMPGEWIYEGSIPFLEIYEGILIAVDSLRSLGLTVELDVYDTGADSSQISRLIWSGALDNIDLIIGPVFSFNINHLAAFAAQHDIPVVSPVPLRDQNILENKPSLYRVFPSVKVSDDIIIDEAKTHRGSNIVFLYSDTLMNDPRTWDLWHKLTMAMIPDSMIDSTLITPYYFTGLVSKDNAYSGVTSFDSLLRPDRENLIILAATQTPVVSAAFSTLHSLSRKYNIKVIGYPEIRGLETVDLKYYYDLELFIPTESYIDFDTPAVKAFTAAFMKRFKTEPVAESYAWQGFDIAYFFIGGIAGYGKDFLRDPGMFSPGLLCLEPDFRRDSRNDGYENRGMYIMHYKKDMTIEVRRPWPVHNNIFAEDQRAD